MTKHNKSSLRAWREESLQIKKFSAPQTMTVCGKSSQWTLSPCECTDTITCAYCVQASLLEFEKKPKVDDTVIDKIIVHIIKNGIRKTARDLGIDYSTLKYWLKSRNLPQWIVKKYAGVGK